MLISALSPSAAHTIQKLSAQQEQLIRYTADWVATHGEAMRAIIVEKEAGNPAYDFLVQPDSAGGMLFRLLQQQHAAGRGSAPKHMRSPAARTSSPQRSTLPRSAKPSARLTSPIRQPRGVVRRGAPGAERLRSPQRRLKSPERKARRAGQDRGTPPPPRPTPQMSAREQFVLREF
eukprot:SAG11_NODE_2472_length_3319_cov_2.525155_3_plen_176_part_00